MDIQTIKDAESEIRDAINLIAVFETEYNLPAEVVNDLRSKLESVAKKLVE